MAEETEKRPVASQFCIKLYPDEKENFKRIREEMDGVRSDREALVALMEFYENPKTVVKDNPELKQRIAELQAELETRTNEIVDIRKQLDDANNALNANGEAGTQLQLRIEQLEAENAALKESSRHPDNFVGGTLPPVPMHFLTKMAELQSRKDKQERTPFWVLANNFIQDLQNPLSNHLPVIVSSDELRRAQAEYEKSVKPAEKEEE